MVAPVAFFAVASLIGTGFQIAGQRASAKAKEEAAFREAELKRQQAFDILERFEINKGFAILEGENFKSEQLGAFIKGGLAIGEGASLLALEQTNRTLQRTLDLEKFEVDSQVEALRQGASFDEIFAQKTRKAADTESLGLFFSGAGRVAAGAK